MDDLRRRLHFHSVKIRLVIDRLTVNLMTDGDSKHDSVVAITTEIWQISHDIRDEVRLLTHHLLGGEPGTRPLMTQTLPNISSDLALRFQEALEINRPSAYGAELPLAEAFDALYYRFDEVVNAQARVQTPENRLQLLKCCWLLCHIQESPEYLEASPAFYYRRAVTQVDIGLRTRVRRVVGTDAYDQATLLALPDNLFEIWLPPPTPEPVASISQQPDPISEQGMERRLARIELATEGGRAPDVVHVFQQSAENYRIALETTTSTGKLYIDGQHFYTREHRLIPRYALPMPESIPSIPEVGIFAQNQSHFYRFQRFEDLWKFQTAFTGYEVSHDQPAVKCQFGPNLDSFICDGHIQLWQEPVEFKGPDQDVMPNTTSSAQSRMTSLAPSAHTTNFTLTKEAIIAENIKHSAIVIYTKVTSHRHGDRFAIIFLELGDNIFIDQQACACKHGYKKCSKLVIAAKKKARLRLRMIYSTETAGVQDPNTFDVLPLRLPRRPDFGAIRMQESEHIILKFQDLPAKELFHDEINNRFTVRDAQRRHMYETQRKFLYMASHPPRKDQQRNPHDLRRQSTANSRRSSASTLGPAPQIAPPEMGPSLGDAFAQRTDSQPIRRTSRNVEPTSLSTSPLSNGSSMGSTSAGSRTNSTSNTERSRTQEVFTSPTSTSAKMSTQLSGYQINDSSGPQRPQNLTPSSPTDRNTHSYTNVANSPRDTGTTSRIFGQRDTATTVRSSTSNSSGSTAQSPQRQEPNRRESSRSSTSSKLKGFRKHVLSSL